MTRSAPRCDVDVHPSLWRFLEVRHSTTVSLRRGQTASLSTVDNNEFFAKSDGLAMMGNSREASEPEVEPCQVCT